MSLTLAAPVSQLFLVGPAYARKLERLGIFTVRDFLYHLPSRYDDFSVISPINQVQTGETVTVRGKVISIKNQYTRRGFVLQQAEVTDETGKIAVIWFNQRFLPRVMHSGDVVSLSGKVVRAGGKLQLESPQYELMKGETIHTGRLVPVYPETAGVSSKWLRSRMTKLLALIANGALATDEYLDETLREKCRLPTTKEALLSVHFPKSLEQARVARDRLAFDELLLAELAARERKRAWEKTTVGNKLEISTHRQKLAEFIRRLPFSLTGAQKKAISDIYQDLGRSVPMNRLLAGDVGSGKIVVAALAMLATYLNNFQSVLMAPTEVLAQQHYQTLNNLLAPFNIKVGIATGSVKEQTDSMIMVGTHALLSDKLNFSRLGLVVIDEQHRFGVEQRALLTAKGSKTHPHILTMTATPIPRTIALTIYKDLAVSTIDEMPKNRLPVKTWLVGREKRAAAYDWIRKQRTQTFIICPLIDPPVGEEPESLQSVKSVKAEYERLTKEVFPDLRLGLLHGRLKSKEKDRVLSAFRRGEIDVLVATPVVEVGIDIPGATIMVIEGADRFGLAQLHQLRGRVGRGDTQSYCLLFTEAEGEISRERLKYLETVHNGLALSEIDFRFRGPGQRFGTAQHGKWDFVIADLTDLALLRTADQASDYIEAHPARFTDLLKTTAETKIRPVAPN